MQLFFGGGGGGGGCKCTEGSGRGVKKEYARKLRTKSTEIVRKKVGFLQE